MVQLSDLVLLNQSRGKVIYEHAESASHLKWPQSSPFPCFNCAAKFPGPPVKIPSYQPLGCYGPSKQAIEYFGNFCSFPCARRYIVDRRDPMQDIQLRDLEGMEYEWVQAKLVSSRRVGSIAPDPYLLHTGHMALEEYRGGMLADGSHIELLRRPCVPEEMVLRRRLPAPEQMEETINTTQESTRHHIKSLRRPASLGGIRALSNLVINTPTKENRCRKACESSYLSEYLKRKREQQESGSVPDDSSSGLTPILKKGGKGSGKGKKNNANPSGASPNLAHLSQDAGNVPSSTGETSACGQTPANIFKKPAPKNQRKKKVQLPEHSLPSELQADSVRAEEDVAENKEENNEEKGQGVAPAPPLSILSPLASPSASPSASLLASASPLASALPSPSLSPSQSPSPKPKKSRSKRKNETSGEEGEKPAKKKQRVKAGSDQDSLPSLNPCKEDGKE